MNASCRLVGAILALCFASAQAQPIQVNNAGMEISETRYVLNADFHLDLTGPLLEALNNGVSLGFLIEFELTRPRWWWFDEVTARRRTQWRLSYSALSRQYRLTTGALHQNFAQLEEALDVMRRLRNWQVLERSVRLSGSNYEAAVRMRLDTTQLPRPLQISALTNRELRLESPWKTVIYQPSPVPPVPAPLPASVVVPPPIPTPPLGAPASQDGQGVEVR